MFKKCRQLIDDYGRRSDLLEERSLDIQQAMIYTNYSKDELIEHIKSGSIKYKVHKSGKVTIKVKGAWQYDDGSLVDTGGACIDFKPHSGIKISCIQDIILKNIKHPNEKKLPGANEVQTIENTIREFLLKSQNKQDMFEIGAD